MRSIQVTIAIRSSSRVRHRFRSRTFHTVVIAGHPHVAADPLTGTASEILTATGTEWPTH